MVNGACILNGARTPYSARKTNGARGPGLDEEYDPKIRVKQSSEVIILINLGLY